MKRFWAGLAVLVMVVAGAAWAQQPAPVDVGPGVARVSLISGDASTQRGDSGDWVAATLNTPVVAGDRVSTGNEGRLELQLDAANVARLAGATTVKVANLDRNQIQVQVGRGLVTYAVLRGSQASAEIDTPNVAVHPLSEGDYRVLVSSDDETQVIVRRGAADVSTPQGSTRVEQGQMITVRGTNNPEYQTASAPGRDDWDKWNSDRDRTINNAQSWSRTNRYYTGAADLDAYGQWEYVADYDYVWFPSYGPGWAPYRDGRWVWEPYWGWTWVSYEPWGWAPYHYGRWALYGGRWGWWPGPVYGYPGYYPVWAPAYVSFFGFGFGGGGWSFGFGFGWNSVGWLPLGPGDYCYPWWGRWGHGFRYARFHDRDGFHRGGHDGWDPIWRGRHGRGISNLDLAARDERVRHGISTMPGDQFGRGRVAVSQRGVDAAQFRQAGLLTGAVPVTPSRESLRVSDRAVSPATMHDGSQRFFTRSRPAAAPASFSQQAAQVQRTLDAARGQMGGAGTPNGRPAGTPAGGAVGTQPNAGGGRPSEWAARGAQGGNSGRAVTPSGSPASQPAQPGWHSFGGGARPNTPASPTQEWRSGRSGAPVTPPAQRTPSTPNESPRQGSGWRTFTPPSGRGAVPSARTPYTPNESSGRGSGNWQPAPRTPYTPNESSGRSSGSWQPAPRSPYTPNEASRGGWQTTAPRSTPYSSQAPSRPAYGGGSWSGSRAGSSRPPLNMQQPIVRPRGGYSGSYGGSRGGSNVYRGGGGGYSGGGGSYRGGSSGGGSHSSGGHSSSGGGGSGRRR